MASRKTAKKQKQRRQGGLLTKAVLLILLGAIGWQLHSLRAQVQDAQAERDDLSAQVAAQQRENEALAADIAEGVSQEKMMEIARDELGLVSPNERVFYDVSN